MGNRRTQARSMLPHLSPVQYDLIYNMTSLGLASMAASTVFFFLRLQSFGERYKAALCFTGLVTFIAMYHYFRIFNSFVEAYTPCMVKDGEVFPNKCDADKYGYSPTGISFNAAYRYVDWLLTVPLLLIEIVLVMRLDESETVKRCTTLGVSSSHDRQRISWRDIRQSEHPLVLLVPLHDSFHLHRVHSLRRPQGVSRLAARGMPQPGQVGMLG